MRGGHLGGRKTHLLPYHMAFLQTAHARRRVEEDELLLLLLPLFLWEGGRILVIKGAQRQEAEVKARGKCFWFIYSFYRILNVPKLCSAQSSKSSLNECCTNKGES